jgi:hypothetical protein
MRVNESEGAIAQLGERCNRTAEVVSSNLIGSTNQNKHLAHRCLGAAAALQAIATATPYLSSLLARCWRFRSQGACQAAIRIKIYQLSGNDFAAVLSQWTLT